MVKFFENRGFWAENRDGGVGFCLRQPESVWTIDNGFVLPAISEDRGLRAGICLTGAPGRAEKLLSMKILKHETCNQQQGGIRLS
jgi:hypothetical protein